MISYREDLIKVEYEIYKFECFLQYQFIVFVQNILKTTIHFGL